ncbi:hypothetical protein [Acidithiobacillus ferridurans]|uniref:Uncharacterized protein n=1 Tax=Acidithiobacillus ferridurans TaxID=1232575 RepID=A0A8X8G740_ACIFI|nr:hypothetical protein [Acidithiobacillus ferridurans]MBU2715807.1 hypothetical protein [Acidithiobacillus ferridurans]MBU2722804.1 hypothetical protein [Acidithiobacillus ferridurans]MBU2727809.1 hypothetical protein [Acidithiobacillus ferridurans]
MRKISPEDRLLRECIRASHSTNRIRFLLAIWPDTWTWLRAYCVHFHGLPTLSSSATADYSQEVLCAVHTIGHLSNSLTNGKLRAAVHARLSETIDTCAKTVWVNADDEAWDWVHHRYELFASESSTRIEAHPRELPDFDGAQQVGRLIFGDGGTPSNGRGTPQKERCDGFVS